VPIIKHRNNPPTNPTYQPIHQSINQRASHLQCSTIIGTIITNFVVDVHTSQFQLPTFLNTVYHTGSK
jgi:hypothetical protein